MISDDDDILDNINQYPAKKSKKWRRILTKELSDLSTDKHDIEA